MMDWLVPLGLFLLLALTILVSTAVESLRDFSRSRLEECCRAVGKPLRFGQILKQYYSARVSLEHLSRLLTGIIAALWLAWQCPAIDWSAGTVRWSWTLFAGWLALPWLTFGLPWSLARLAGEIVLARGWRVWVVLSALASPYGWFARSWDLFWHRVLNQSLPETQENETIADEIRSVTEEGHREGTLEAEARTMIHRVIDFYDVDVADIMTPRTEIVSISSEASLQDAQQIVLEEGHSRVPVIGRTPDEIVGILYARDLLRYFDGGLGVAVTLADISRDPYYVPKTMGIDSLLKSLKKDRVQIAIVLDEYGGVAGLVTMEDILEELVGEIADEFDSAAEGEEFRRVDDQTSDIYAKAHLDDVNDRLGLEIPADGEIDTVGGFVFSLLGRIPVIGEQVRWRNLEFTILEAHKRRIVRLRVKVLPPETHEE